MGYLVQINMLNILLSCVLKKDKQLGMPALKKKKKDCLHKSTYVSKGVSQQALLHYVLILNV